MSAPIPYMEGDGLDGLTMRWLAARPGSAPRYHTSVTLAGEHDVEHCPECQDEKLDIRLTRVEERYGHAGTRRLPVARRPYARRKRPRSRRFVEDIPAWEPEQLRILKVEEVWVPIGRRSECLRRYWICPVCGGQAQRLYPTDRRASDTPELPDAGCRRCARLVWRAQYEGGKGLITPKRIEQALERGPRRRSSPARLRYELRTLAAARQLATRDTLWQQRWEAAMLAWLAWHEVEAARQVVRLARMRLAELREHMHVHAFGKERQAVRDELREARERKRLAQQHFEQVQAAYDRLAAAASA